MESCCGIEDAGAASTGVAGENPFCRRIVFGWQIFMLDSTCWI